LEDTWLTKRGIATWRAVRKGRCARRARRTPRRIRRAQRNTDELRESARRVEASTPPEARDRTVQEMTRDAERNADRSRG
jgi:hypothetical protein